MSTEKKTEMASAKDRKKLEAVGEKYGITNITDEEYEANKKFTVMTALHRIKNARKGVHKARERETHKGIALGGRDFVYKGITVEKSKTQFISVLLNTDEGPVLEEFTQWGHFKGADAGDGCEFEIERSESTLNDGSTRENKTIRKLTRKKKGVIKTYSDLVESKVKIHKPGELDEDNLYEVVAVEGEVTNVDPMPIWGDSEDGEPVREGDQPIWQNELPCFRLGLKSEDGVRVNLNYQPTRLAAFLIDWPADFTEIAKMDDIQEILLTFVGSKVLGIGCIRKIRDGEEGIFLEIDATALFVKEQVMQDTLDVEGEEETPEEPEAEAEEEPKEEAEEEEEAPKKEKKAEKKADPPAKKATTNIDSYKAAVSELMDTLDTTELEIEDVKNAKILPDTLTDALIQAIIKKVKAER